MFKDGVAVDRIVGFEGVSEDDSFETIQLTRRLVKSKVLRAKNRSEKRTVIRRGNVSDSDSDFED